MHYIHKVGCTSVRQVPVTGTCSFRLTTQIWRDLCLSETQIHRSSDLWVSHGYTCVDPQVTQTCAQPYKEGRGVGCNGVCLCLSLPVNAYLVPHTHVHMNYNIIKCLIKHIFE